MISHDFAMNLAVYQIPSRFSLNFIALSDGKLYL